MIQYPQHDQQYYTTFTRDLLRFLNLPKMSKHEFAKDKICRWCCTKVVKIRIENNSLKGTKLGEYYSVL